MIITEVHLGLLTIIRIHAGDTYKKKRCHVGAIRVTLSLRHLVLFGRERERKRGIEREREREREGEWLVEHECPLMISCSIHSPFTLSTPRPPPPRPFSCSQSIVPRVTTEIICPIPAKAPRRPQSERHKP